MASQMPRKKYVRSQPVRQPPVVSAFSQTHTCSRFRLSSNHTASPTYSPPGLCTSKALKFALCRLKLQWISGLLAGTSLILSVFSRWTAGRESPTTAATMGVCSLVQVWLVLSYWAQERKSVLWIGRATSREPPKSRRMMCALECLFHLLIPFPKACLVLGFRVNTIAYVLLLSRNYHTFRLLYWISPFSSLLSISPTFIRLTDSTSSSCGFIDPV